MQRLKWNLLDTSPYKYFSSLKEFPFRLYRMSSWISMPYKSDLRLGHNGFVRVIKFIALCLRTAFNLFEVNKNNSILPSWRRKC